MTAPSPVAGETPEMVEAYEGLVASIRAGLWPTLGELQAWLASAESTYPARMVYFGQAAWESADGPVRPVPAGCSGYRGLGGQIYHWRVDDCPVHPGLDEPVDGEAIPPEADRIRNGVAAVQEAWHGQYTSEAQRERLEAAARMAALNERPMVLPPDDDGSVARMYHEVTGLQADDGTDYWRLNPAQQAAYQAQLRRTARIAWADEAAAWLRSATFGVVLVLVLLVGWSILMNGWRWWA